MKQHVLYSEIEALPKDLKDKMFSIFNNPMLTIGDMIEYLGKNWKPGEKRRGYIIDFNEVDQLCDYLFEMVKEVLTNEIH